ncbi:MAG: 16S rRNA (guanine(966)-N(2))-methyltransferase RsmD [Candidatus Margulisiibacteriota bacterium]
MRVIGGTARGRVLKTALLAGGKKIRPLSDRAKEALFNILAQVTPDCVFLDLFAGSGQVGIEALSRGAKLCVFCEKESGAVRFINDNLELCGFSDRAEIFALDVLSAISVLDKNKALFDVIFIGAPYGRRILLDTLEKISKSGILKVNGIVIAEHTKRQEAAREYGGLKKFRENRYGDTVFSFYRRGGFETRPYK